MAMNCAAAFNNTTSSTSVLKGDGGNYLLRVKPSTGYAEAALNEPWACVEASYTLTYRTAWKKAAPSMSVAAAVACAWQCSHLEAGQHCD